MGLWAIWKASTASTINGNFNHSALCSVGNNVFLFGKIKFAIFSVMVISSIVGHMLVSPQCSMSEHYRYIIIPLGEVMRAYLRY